MRTYELMVIHRPEMSEDDVRGQVAQIEGILRNEGGSISSTDFWGKRRFAYEIGHLHEGYYSVVTFAAGIEIVEMLDRTLTLADTVIRHKILRPDTLTVDVPAAGSEESGGETAAETAAGV